MSTALSCGVDVRPGSLTGVPVVQICRPASKGPGPLWEVIIDGVRRFGPAMQEECQAFVADIHPSPPDSPAERIPAEAVQSMPPAVELEAEELTYSVVLFPIKPHLNFKPRNENSHFPCEHGQLPYSIAADLVSVLNERWERCGRKRRSFVGRYLHDTRRMFTVQTADLTPNPLKRGEFGIRDVMLSGAELNAATEEARRINGDILRYSHEPKVWAILMVDGPRGFESHG